MLREKEEKYIELVKDIKDCEICQSIKAPAYCEAGECLVNDCHGIVDGQKICIDDIYANRWNMWQGSLNAEIMVVGLDFGRILTGDIEQSETHHWWKDGKQSDSEKLSEWKSPTDKNLYRIFKEVFGDEFALTQRCDKLYFTNVACCYRQRRTSGLANEAWYAFCARRYLGRLIQIIDPKLIVCLGMQVFEALGCCEDSRIICTDTNKPKGKMTLKDLLNTDAPYHFELEIGGKRIKTAVAFHPGTNRNRNRKKEEEIADWERIRKLYEQAKSQ